MVYREPQDRASNTVGATHQPSGAGRVKVSFMKLLLTLIHGYLPNRLIETVMKLHSRKEDIPFSYTKHLVERKSVCPHNLSCFPLGDWRFVLQQPFADPADHVFSGR